MSNNCRSTNKSSSSNGYRTDDWYVTDFRFKVGRLLLSDGGSEIDRCNGIDLGFFDDRSGSGIDGSGSVRDEGKGIGASFGGRDGRRSGSESGRIDGDEGGGGDSCCSEKTGSDSGEMTI